MLRKLLNHLAGSERHRVSPLPDFPPADDPEGKPVLDDLAYATDLWNRLLASEVISDQDLTDLASARAAVIRAAFLADGQFDEKRVINFDILHLEIKLGGLYLVSCAIGLGGNRCQRGSSRINALA